jgi:Spy/CpxP family protein refolding chaperone
MTAPGSRRPPPGPLMAVLVLLLVAFAGGLAGVAMDRLLLLPRMFRGPGFGHEHGPGGPPRDREFRARFARELGLTSDQQIRIDSIMDRQGRELRAVRGQVQPKLDSIITRTRRELDSVLTPEQRKKAEEIRRKHPRPPGPPPGMFGPGPPPGGPPPGGPPPEGPPR